MNKLIAIAVVAVVGIGAAIDCWRKDPEPAAPQPQ